MTSPDSPQDISETSLSPLSLQEISDCQNFGALLLEKYNNNSSLSLLVDEPTNNSPSNKDVMKSGAPFDEITDIWSPLKPLEISPTENVPMIYDRNSSTSNDKGSLQAQASHKQHINATTTIIRPPTPAPDFRKPKLQHSSQWKYHVLSPTLSASSSATTTSTTSSFESPDWNFISGSRSNHNTKDKDSASNSFTYSSSVGSSNYGSTTSVVKGDGATVSPLDCSPLDRSPFIRSCSPTYCHDHYHHHHHPHRSSSTNESRFNFDPPPQTILPETTPLAAKCIMFQKTPSSLESSSSSSESESSPESGSTTSSSTTTCPSCCSDQCITQRKTTCMRWFGDCIIASLCWK